VLECAVRSVGMGLSSSSTESSSDWVFGVRVACGWHGFSFPHKTLALALRRYSCLLERSVQCTELSGSLNATTSKEQVFSLRVGGGWTQPGFCVTLRVAYKGL
jgi:hypothetical protein